MRAMFDRDEDMTITGQRHPFFAKYKLAFTKEGNITACEIFLYTNGGNSADLSLSVSHMYTISFYYSVLSVAFSCRRLF